MPVAVRPLRRPSPVGPSPIARVGAVALLLALPGALAAQAPERHTLRGADVAVWDLAGRVEVVPGSGSEVVVDVARGGREGARLRVENGALDGRPSLRVVFPDDRIVYPAIGRGSRTTLRLRRDGTFGGGGFGADRVEIRGDGAGVEAWADLTVRIPRGQKLTVHLAAGTVAFTNVDGDLTAETHSAGVVAERVRGRLAVDAGGGSVRVRSSDAELDLDTGSGAVELEHVRGPRLRVDTGSGSIRAAGIDATSVEFDTGSGSARATGLRARRLRIDTGSGSVDVALAGDLDEGRIDTGSGAATVRIPPELGAELVIDTGSGSITSELPIVVSARERDRLEGRIGDGRGRLVIDTGSGSVRLLRP